MPPRATSRETATWSSDTPALRCTESLRNRKSGQQAALPVRSICFFSDETDRSHGRRLRARWRPQAHEASGPAARTIDGAAERHRTAILPAGAGAGATNTCPAFARVSTEGVVAGGEHVVIQRPDLDGSAMDAFASAAQHRRASANHAAKGRRHASTGDVR